uniref:Uncharacterized protein n=1 Tax=Romanomermis culicivorax TaxID=13658 RepID=A0A915JZ16_ROMCU
MGTSVSMSSSPEPDDEPTPAEDRLETMKRYLNQKPLRMANMLTLNARLEKSRFQSEQEKRL